VILLVVGPVLVLGRAGARRLQGPPAPGLRLSDAQKHGPHAAAALSAAFAVLLPVSRKSRSHIAAPLRRFHNEARFTEAPTGTTEIPQLAR
jgi:hypothetical protein